MNPDEFDERRVPSLPLLVVDLIKSRLLALVLLAAGGFLAVSYFGIDLSLSRRAKLAGLTFLFLTPAGYMVGNYIVSILYNPHHIWLVDLDARTIDGALYRFPYGDFRDLDVTDADGNADTPYEMTRLSSHLYAGKQVDLESMTVVGTWRGTLDDRELARALQKVRECRGQLEDDAKRGFVLETSAFTIVRSAARDAALDVVEMFQQGTLPDAGASINDAVDEALQQFEFEEELDESLLDRDTSVAEASQDPGDDGLEDHPLNRYSEGPGQEEMAND